MSEARIMSEIVVALSKEGARLFRNQAGTYELKDGRYLSSGLCDGASDLVGWSKDGRFLAVEVKAPGSHTDPERLKKQIRFIEAVNKAGGIGFFAESVEEAIYRLKAAHGKD